MRYTDIHDIPCLGDEDYPAVALYMQELALRIEADLDAQQTALETFLDTGSAIWAAPAPTNIPNGVTLGLPDRFYVLNIVQNVGGAGLDQTPFDPTLPALRGWYYVGANVNLVATGAVTANSRRLLRLRITTLGLSFTGLDLAPGSQSLATFDSQIVTANTALGDNLWAGGTYFSDGLGVYPVHATVFHDNTSSLDTTLLPAARIWIVYMGDSPDIREVA